MTPDMINGLFELFGAAVSTLNIRSLYKDKTVKGFNPWTTVFFTAWGFWNVYFYTHLDQYWSFMGGLAIVSVNCVWLGMLVYYTMNEVSKVHEELV